jgi:hypothetical protein
MGLKGLIAVATALLLAGCAYKGAEQERHDKITLQALGMQIFMDYLDPALGRKFTEALEKDDPSIISQLPVRPDREIIDPTRIDPSRFAKNSYQTSLVPMVTDKVAFTGSLTADRRMVAMVFALVPRGAEKIAPWAGRAYPAGHSDTIKEWTEEHSGLVYSFGYYRQRKEQQADCAAVWAGNDAGNFLAIVCGEKGTGFGGLEAAARTARLEGRIAPVGR